MTEVWKDIIGYNGRYQVSNEGKIRSFVKTSAGLILSPNNNGAGYLSVQLGRDNRLYIHRLVCDAFYGPSDLEVNHKDFNKSNNCIDNLEYVTRETNQRHMIIGGKHNRAKLTRKDRHEIKKLALSGVSRTDLCSKFKVSKSTISSIISNTTWSWDNENF